MSNKQLFKKIIAEKLDGMKAFPHKLVPQAYIEELKQIPRPVLGHVSGVESFGVLYESLKHMKADALVLMIAYTGTGYGEHRTLWQEVQVLKSTIEKALHIYCTEPVVIGSPQFWRALNGRFVQELISRYNFYCPCFGCRLYLCALTVPLCKTLNIETVVSGNISMNAGGDYATNTIQYYCAHLLSNFGITLLYRTIDYKDNDKILTEFIKSQPGMGVEQHEECGHCMFHKNVQLLNGRCEEPANLPEFFERFLIPACAKIISKILSGRDFEYCDEVADVLMPGTKRTYKRHRRAPVLKRDW